MDMNYDLTTKGVEMFKEMLAKNQLQEILRVERRALKKAGETTNTAVIKTVGEAMTNRYIDRGWEIRSHTPSNYTSALPHYTLIKNKIQLGLDLAHDLV